MINMTNINNFNAFANISNTLNTNPKSSTLEIEKDEVNVQITAFTKKVEGDYSTYSAAELSELSYNEIKKNYEEIKKELDSRMKESQDILNSESFKNYQKRFLISNPSEIRGGSKDQEVYFNEVTSNFMNEDKITDNMLDKQYGEVTRVNKETQELLNFNDKFKIVNYFDNDEINRAIYSNYEDNAQVFYDYSDPVDLDGSNGFFAGSSYSIQGTDLKQIVQSIEDAIEFIDAHGFISSDKQFDNQYGYNHGFIISGEEITISNKTFSLYEVKKSVKNDYSKNEDNQIKENTEVASKTEEIENEDIKPDYNTYSATQLRQITFDEAKKNYEDLKKILDDSLKNISSLNKKDTDNLLAFKAQLEKVAYLKDDTLNETIYNKLQNIEDPKVTVWSNLAINENIENLQNGNLDSIIIDGLLIYPSDIQKNEDNKDNDENQKEDKNPPNTQQVDAKALNLDSIIDIVEKSAKNAGQTPPKTYNKNIIEAYSNFISQYNEIKNNLFS